MMPASRGALSALLRRARPAPGEARRLLALARPDLTSVAAALVLQVVAVALGLSVPWLLSGFFDGLAEADLAAVTRLSALLLALLMARAGATAVQGYLLQRAGEGVVLRLRRRLFGHLLHLGLPFHDAQRTGGLVSRLTNDVAQIQALTTTHAAALVTGALTFVGAAGILLWHNLRLAALLVVLVPPVVLLARVFGRRLARRAGGVQDRLAEMAGLVQESTGAIRIVQSFVREPFEASRFARSARALYEATLGLAGEQARFGLATSALTYVALAVVVWFGGREVVLGRSTPGALVAYVLYASMLASATSQLIGLYGGWSAALGAGRRVFELLDEPPTVATTPGARGLPVVAGRLRLEDVTFAYRPDGRAGAVIRGVDLEIAPGETVALVGPSGAGKSTVMHLLARFYDPTSGRVLVDGLDLREVRLDDLRGHIGLVPQDPLLFDASVADNLRYGRLDATEAELEAAARAAHAHPFIARLPAGYDTPIGERGIRLSTGERQRLSIARALLKDPRILLLDEATASLDTRSEHLVQAALETLMAGRTTVVIAHRLSTVLRADRIVVLDDGRIVEQGPHGALLAAGGLYAHLHALQFRDEEAEAPE